MTNLSIELELLLYSLLSQISYKKDIGKIKLYRIADYTDFTCKLITEKTLSKSSNTKITAYCYDKDLTTIQKMRKFLTENNKAGLVYFHSYQELNSYLENNQVSLMTSFKRSGENKQSVKIVLGERHCLLSEKESNNHQYSKLLWPDKANELQIYIQLTLYIGNSAFDISPIYFIEKNIIQASNVVGYDILINFTERQHLKIQLVKFVLRNGIINLETNNGL